MTRFDVLQAILETRKGNTYLEIGLGSGSPIMRLDARRKFGVDPVLPRVKRRLQCHLRDLARGRRTRFFGMTSDAFFARHAARFASTPVDLAFVDGLHTAEQAYLDVEHCLRYLAPGGIVVMHDCNPPSAQAATPLPDLAGQVDHDWYGDVWRAVVRLRATRPDLAVFTLDCDCGLAVVTRAAAEASLGLPPAALAGLTYPQLAADRARLLNLKPPAFLADFLAGLRD
jgi:SAM-dependent methyltransferase